MAILIGVIGGLAVLALARFDSRFAASTDEVSGGVSIGINGVSRRMARDVLLPTHGWVLHVELPGASPEDSLDGVEVTLREERTGMSVRIEDRMTRGEGFMSLVIPEPLGLSEGLLSIQARRVDASGRQSSDWRRVRIRSWMGGPPIGSRQVIALDFDSDRDGDGHPDFLLDLERFGLAAPSHPELSEVVSRRIAGRALARVERAYDADYDPNRTTRQHDAVRLRFLQNAEGAAFTTRICVGGGDPTDEASVGHVTFDLRNEHKSSVECEGSPAVGVFPGALVIYEESELYARTFGPLIPTRGGVPVGTHPLDGHIMKAYGSSPEPSAPDLARRRDEIERAIEVFADVLGSIIAHEVGHALGLVAPGKPGVGLFGSTKGEAYAHNLDPQGEASEQPWLMNPGRGFTFEELAGEAEGGELRFRPLNYAYLRDRVVLVDGRK